MPASRPWSRKCSAIVVAVNVFVVVMAFMVFYYRGSRGQDATGDPAVSARLRKFAGPAIIVLALTQTFASIDCD